MKNYLEIIISYWFHIHSQYLGKSVQCFVRNLIYKFNIVPKKNK